MPVRQDLMREAGAGAPRACVGGTGVGHEARFVHLRAVGTPRRRGPGRGRERVADKLGASARGPRAGRGSPSPADGGVLRGRRSRATPGRPARGSHDDAAVGERRPGPGRRARHGAYPPDAGAGAWRTQTGPSARARVREASNSLDWVQAAGARYPRPRPRTPAAPPWRHSPDQAACSPPAAPSVRCRAAKVRRACRRLTHSGLLPGPAVLRAWPRINPRRIVERSPR
jgi:hypothetical protein